MMRIRTLTILFCSLALFSMAANCTMFVEGEGDAEAEEAYGSESAEQQTMDEQMEEVDEDINR
jgi:hypothetical protein